MLGTWYVAPAFVLLLNGSPTDNGRGFATRHSKHSLFIAYVSSSFAIPRSRRNRAVSKSTTLVAKAFVYLQLKGIMGVSTTYDSNSTKIIAGKA